MFSTEFNGYEKREVDEFISRLKSNYEKALMEEKLKVLDAERKLLEINKRASEIENKEKNIMSMLESFKKHEAEGSRNIEVLKSEQLRMVYVQLKDFLTKLNEREPGLLLNSNYKKLLSDIEDILASANSRREEIVGSVTESDPMRVLLSKMQGKKIQDIPREVKIERFDKFERVERPERYPEKDRPTLIKPVTQMQLDENDEYDNLVDKFLDTKPPEEQPRSMKIQSNGFDLKEAINPKDDLSEIMKAFDFYGGEDDGDGAF